MRRILIAAIVFLACAAANAQDVQVSLKLDSTNILIGGWIPARMEVKAPGNFKVIIPKSSTDFDHAELVSGTPETVEQQGGAKKIVKPYTLTSFDTGAVDISVRVKYYKPGDTTAYFAASNTQRVNVRMVRIDTTKSFRDIKDVLHVSLTIWDYLLYLSVILAVAAAGWYGYKWYKKRPEPEPEVEPVPEVPADVVALEKLRSLEQEHRWEQGDHKGFQSELTGIVREYIEHGFGVPALEQITTEIVSGVALLGFDPEIIVRLEQALRIADMTKFARYVPSPPEHHIALKIAYEFIERTRPRLRSNAHLVDAPAGEGNV
jgi:hypothetical protein